MQLKFIPGFKPLTLVAVATMSSTPLAYSDIDPFMNNANIITNSDTARYFNSVIDYEGKQVYDRLLFERLKSEWQANTQFLSSPKQIVEDKSFQSIVAMGKNAVPFILEDIRDTPSTLVWALNLIFKAKISDKQNVSIEEACKLWLKVLR